jgi:RimJ/RimL family protein N-acetyltransferase
MTTVTELRARVRGGVDRHGLRGSLWRLAEIAKSIVYRNEHHVWFGLDLPHEDGPASLPDGIVLHEGTPADAEAIAFTSLMTTEIADRLSAGGTLWLARDGDAVAFCCWTFPRRTPVLAATGGWLELPDGVACLEDSVTAPDHRGRGLAPAAWAIIAARLAAQDLAQLVTKVETTNAPSIRAVEKAHFRRIALMTYRRVGPHERVRLDVIDRDETALALERLLAR